MFFRKIFNDVSLRVPSTWPQTTPISFLPISGESPVLLHFQKLSNVFAKYVRCLAAYTGVTIVFSNETTNGWTDTNFKQFIIQQMQKYIIRIYN